jgi:hypothetical protein
MLLHYHSERGITWRYLVSGRGRRRGGGGGGAGARRGAAGVQEAHRGRQRRVGRRIGGGDRRAAGASSQRWWWWWWCGESARRGGGLTPNRGHVDVGDEGDAAALLTAHPWARGLPTTEKSPCGPSGPLQDMCNFDRPISGY